MNFETFLPFNKFTKIQYQILLMLTSEPTSAGAGEHSSCENLKQLLNGNNGLADSDSAVE